MKAIERAIAILNHLASNGSPRGVTELARDLRLSKSNTHRALSALEALDWVVQDRETGKYRIGNRVLQLGLSVLSHLDLRTVSLPYLNKLRDATNETAVLTARLGLEVMFVDQIQSSYEVRLVADLGRRLPLWRGSAGKVVMAYLQEEEVATVIDNLKRSGTQILASGQVADVDNLKTELEEIRRRGFAISVGERVLGATGVAAPIFAHDHTIVGAISVVGILPRFTPERALACGPMVAQAANEISLVLGASDRAEHAIS